ELGDSWTRLRELGVPLAGIDALDGQATVDARVGRNARGLWIDGKATGANLVLRNGRVVTRARGVDVTAALRPGQPMAGRVGMHEAEIVAVTGRGEAAGPQPYAMKIREASLALRGQPQRMAGELTAALADGTRAQASLHADVGHGRAVVRLDALDIEGERTQFH